MVWEASAAEAVPRPEAAVPRIQQPTKPSVSEEALRNQQQSLRKEYDSAGALLASLEELLRDTSHLAATPRRHDPTESTEDPPEAPAAAEPEGEHEQQHSVYHPLRSRRMSLSKCPSRITFGSAQPSESPMASRAASITGRTHSPAPSSGSLPAIRVPGARSGQSTRRNSLLGGAASDREPPLDLDCGPAGHLVSGQQDGPVPWPRQPRGTLDAPAPRRGSLEMPTSVLHCGAPRGPADRRGSCELPRSISNRRGSAEYQPTINRRGSCEQPVSRSNSVYRSVCPSPPDSPRRPDGLVSSVSQGNRQVAFRDAADAADGPRMAGGASAMRLKASASFSHGHGLFEGTQHVGKEVCFAAAMSDRQQVHDAAARGEARLVDATPPLAHPQPPGKSRSQPGGFVSLFTSFLGSKSSSKHNKHPPAAGGAASQESSFNAPHSVASGVLSTMM